MATAPAEVEVNPGELFAALSLALDLGTGQPLEHALRSCLLTVELADRAGLDDAERADAYHLALLHSIGCTADSPETAARFGNDVRVRAAHAPIDGSSQRELMGFMWRATGPGDPVHLRARRFAQALAGGPSRAREGLRAHCEVGQRLARLLGLSDGVADALWFVFERWDGKGFPRGKKQDEIPRAARVMHVARDLDVLATSLGSAEAAERVIQNRAGGAYDPALTRHAENLIATLPEGSAWEAVAAQPAGTVPLRGEALDSACAAVGYFADLKSVHTLEHSTGVADLAEAAAWRSGRGEPGASLLRRAGLLHDLGRAAISTAIWDKPGALTEPEWERVRLHPYYTSRALARAERLAPVANVASAHHERLDGSGYPSGTTAPALSQAARLLAAADAFQAMTEPRAHRQALAPEAAAAQLESDAKAGRLDAEAVAAVLSAAGQRSARPPRPTLPNGLTERELEVLRLIARGQSNRETAEQLGLSPKTVGHHVQHVYAKIGVSTRAGAAVFAMEHDLLRQ
jgi:HD-GYP domain-containing protein (c-di-GMP phosphodiesterase class II)/predicted DNA-binding protein (UPF0251 family)